MAAPKGNTFAAGNPGGGRPTSFDPSYVAIAKKAAELGATDRDVAEMLSVSETTINAWKLAHKEFSEALKVGKDSADERVVQSLYRRAVGYSYDSEKVFQFQGTVVRAPLVEHVPPDTTAAIFWLKNRRRDDWRDRVEHSGPDGGAITFQEQRLIAIEQLRDMPPERRQLLREILTDAEAQLNQADAIDADYEVRDE